MQLPTISQNHLQERQQSGIMIAGSQIGGVAQLGERLNGIQEVRGSIPLVSTRDFTAGDPAVFDFPGNSTCETTVKTLGQLWPRVCLLFLIYCLPSPVSSH